MDGRIGSEEEYDFFLAFWTRHFSAEVPVTFCCPVLYPDHNPEGRRDGKTEGRKMDEQRRTSRITDPESGSTGSWKGGHMQ